MWELELFPSQNINIWIIIPLFFLFFSRFLHDKNSREFLYYRKKVAEIRKENQNSQAASSQKGNSHRDLGMGTAQVKFGFIWDWFERIWGGNLAAWKENSQLEGDGVKSSCQKC